MNDQLDRHYKMQRLNRRPPTVQELEDAEQMDAIDQWIIDHPNGSIAFNCFVICFALACVAAITMYIRRYDVPPVVYKKPMTCGGCHVQQAATAKTYRQYKALLKSRKLAVRGVDLAELVQP